MKKIMLIGNNDIGMYNFRKELIQRLIYEKYRVYIVLPYGEKVDLLVEMGCKFINTSMDRRSISPINEVKLIGRYIYIINNIQPDLVLTYTIKPNIYAGFICRIKRIPYMANITGLGSAVENSGILEKIISVMYRTAFKDISCVFFQNKANRQWFINNKVLIKNHKLIPGSGVNLRQHSYEEYPADDVVRILFIGRLMRDKGIYELFNLAEKVHKKHNNIFIEIIGFCEENLDEKLKSLIKRNIIHYYGLQNDVHQYIKKAHAVILPSYYEGMSNVLLEASATGRPVLASNIFGCKEIFEEGVTGFGFEPRNVKSLYDAVYKFIKLPFNKKREMGIKARLKIENSFNREFVINAYMEEIQKILYR